MTMASMQLWWRDLPSHIDPYIFELGSFRVGWYGMMYVFAFVTFYALASYRIRREGAGYGTEFLQDYLVWVAVGLIAGARLGYVLFYNLSYYMQHPLEVLLPFDFSDGVRYTGISGMSFHGGLMGTFIATWGFLRSRGADLWDFTDRFMPGVPLGYIFGRMGNFINSELYGRATDAPWAMRFPSDPQGLLRHPSQLYEAFFEGVVLFAVLWCIRRRRPFKGYMFPVYLAGYGTVRFFIEYYREPDSHIGFVLGTLSMGQVLCLAMILVALAVAYFNWSRDERKGETL